MKGSRKQSEVFRDLLAPHMTMLYRDAWRLTGRAEDAEDLVQELLARLYPRTGKLREVDRLAPWLKKALYRQFVDMERKRVRRPESSVQDSGMNMDDMQGPDPDPEVLAQRAADSRRLREALQTLGPESRSLVLMHLVEGYTLAELEGVFQVNAETLKTRLRRAKIRLRKMLHI